MKRVIASVLAFLVLVSIPTPLFAKGEIVKVTIKGADLKNLMEITDLKVLGDANVDVWAGPGVRVNGKEQTEGFIIDWPQGVVAELPRGLQHYEVSFYAKSEEVRLVYVVSYDYNPSTEQGFIYLPGKGEKWFNLNCGTICHGDAFEGNWFRATKAWENAVRPLISKQRAQL